MSKKSAPAPRENPKYEPKASSSSATYVLAGLGVLLVVAVIGWFVWANNRSHEPADQQVLGENATFVLGDPATAPVTIDVFEDFDCPHCKDFVAESGKSLVAAANEGKLAVRYHMLTFLDKNSPSGSYSSRGAGAMLCAAGEGNDVVAALHSAIFGASPAKGVESDPDNAALSRLAGDAGVGDAARTCIAEGQKVDEAKARAAKSQEQLDRANGQVETPKVLKDGKPLDDISGTEWISALVAEPSGS